MTGTRASPRPVPHLTELRMNQHQPQRRAHAAAHHMGDQPPPASPPPDEGDELLWVVSAQIDPLIRIQCRDVDGNPVYVQGTLAAWLPFCQQGIAMHNAMQPYADQPGHEAYYEPQAATG